MTGREEILAELCQLERDERRAELLGELTDCQRLRRELIERGNLDLLPGLVEAEEAVREAIRLWNERGTVVGP